MIEALLGWLFRRRRPPATPPRERAPSLPYDPRLDDVPCEQCCQPLSYRLWQSCTYEPEMCWAAYAINELHLQDLDAEGAAA